jgi:nucleotide-binding universal stress UspA family protein
MSEAVLPPAADLADKTGARVTLLHVLEHGSSPTVHGQRHLMEYDGAEAYLRSIAGRTFAARTNVAWHVHRRRTRDVAGGLVSHADEFEPDLIIMCSHGRVRLRDRLVGSIAQQVLLSRPAPILLMRAGPGGDVRFPFRQVLVPLDGDPDHEHGLGPGAELARICQAPVLLMQVVRTMGSLSPRQAPTGTLLPATMKQVLDLQAGEAVTYLQRHALRLRELGVASSGRVARGSPADSLLATIRETRTDLVVLGSHGKAGSDAFWSGSLTPKLLARAKASFLLVPVPEPV